MFKKLLLASFAALAFAAAAPAQATGQNAGVVINLVVEGNGALMFQLTGTYTGAPACDTASRFGIDTGTAPGKTMASAVLGAYFSGKPLTAYGTGTCTVWGDTENLSFAVLP